MGKDRDGYRDQIVRRIFHLLVYIGIAVGVCSLPTHGATLSHCGPVFFCYLKKCHSLTKLPPYMVYNMKHTCYSHVHVYTLHLWAWVVDHHHAAQPLARKDTDGVYSFCKDLQHEAWERTPWLPTTRPYTGAELAAATHSRWMPNCPSPSSAPSFA